VAWALDIRPNHHSPILNPQSPIPNPPMILIYVELNKIKYFLF